MASATVETQMTPELEPQASLAPPGEGEFPYLFSNEQFFQMIEADVFPREARVYLWEGRVLQKMAKKHANITAGAKFNMTLVRIVPAGWFVNFEASVAIGPGKVPLPDLMVIRGAPDDYPVEYYTAPNIGLAVELSYTSVRHDLGPKMAGYARAGVPIYWVANLIKGVIVEHRDPIPGEGRYASVRTYAKGESIPLRLDDVQVGPIAVNDLLPKV